MSARPIARSAAPEWMDVCALTDIVPLGSRKLISGAITIALIRTQDDRVYAIEDRCPHRGGPLSEGIVSGDRVACPLHGQCVELATGRMVAPDEGQVRTFAAQVLDGRVQVRRDELRAASRPAALKTVEG